MRALRLTAWASEPALVELPDPVAPPGGVVLRVDAAGICATDLHLLGGAVTQERFRLPFTLGHETAGTVQSLGAGVTSVSVGDRVAVAGAWGCGRCERCAEGHENYCEGARPAAPGIGADGGLADLLVVSDPANLVPLPSGLSPRDAASLTDAGVTAYAAVQRSLHKLPAGAVAVVIGVGGVGHLAVQLLKALTPARVVAVDRRPAALDLAGELGADAVVTWGDAADEQIRRVSGGRGADVVLDCVGTDDTLRLAAGVVRGLGDITVVGVGGGVLPVAFGTPAFGATVASSYWGSRRQLVEVLDLAARGIVRVRTEEFALADGARALAALARGDILGRAVVVPGAHD